MDQTQAKLSSDKQRRILSNPWIELGLGLALLLVLLIPLARPYLQPGFQVAHDRITPFLRVQALSDALAHGPILPRWFPQFDGGYSSPYPSFYGMAFYYVAAFFYAIGNPLGSSVELTAFLTLALSGIGMFFLGRHLWGTPGGLLSAGLYVYAPYHLVDAFVRGAYSELAAFIWFPLILLFMLLWQDSGKLHWIAAGAVSIAGLVVTHNILPMVFLPALPILGLFVLQDRARPKRQVFMGWTSMAAMGALLSGYFWLPVMLDRGLIHTQHFLAASYKGDFVGIGPLLTTATQHSLTLEIGVPLLLAVAAGLAGIILSNQLGRNGRLLFISGVLTAGYIFLTNFRSDVIWSHIRVLQFVQFPWRLLAPVDFFLCVIAGTLPAAIGSVRWQWAFALIFPIVALQIHQPLIRIPDRVDQADIEQLTACKDVWGTQDYRPQWSEAAFWTSTSPPQPTAKSPVLPACEGQPVFDPLNGNRIRTFRTAGTDFLLEYDSLEGGSLRIPIYYYPEWHIDIDGSPLAIRPEAGTGLIKLEVPPGDHWIRGDLGRTPAQSAGAALTLLGILAILGWLGMLIVGRSRRG